MCVGWDWREGVRVRKGGWEGGREGEREKNGRGRKREEKRAGRRKRDREKRKGRGKGIYKESKEGDKGRIEDWELTSSPITQYVDLKAEHSSPEVSDSSRNVHLQG